MVRGEAHGPETSDGGVSVRTQTEARCARTAGLCDEVWGAFAHGRSPSGPLSPAIDVDPLEDALRGLG